MYFSPLLLLLLFLVMIYQTKLQTPQDTYSGYSCGDHNYGCRQWSAQGQCGANPIFMLRQCCRSCINACRDTRIDCAEAAKKRYCNQIDWLMACKMSCGMCCSDYDKTCTLWASQKQCATNPRFMLEKCMKSCQACSSPCKPCTEGQYMERWNIEGFQIRSERGVFYRWPKLTSALKEDLLKLKSVVPQPAVRLIQHYSGIFISKLKLCGSYPGCAPPEVADAYHVSPTWLRNNHETPAKAGFVDMQNPGEYMIRRAGVEKYNLLHEFFHAWFDIRRRAALIGDKASAQKEQAVRQAFRLAVYRGLYNKVPYAGGGTRPGYQKESVWEYMGELSEAYFARGIDQNDYYPFNKEQLKQHDPVGFNAIREIWASPYPSNIAAPGP